MTQKTCKISGEEFSITDLEKDILEKISPEFSGKTYPVPESEISAKTRIQNLVLFRNDQFLFQSVSCFSGKKIISAFPPEFSGKICTKKEWFSDIWDPFEYAQEFDFSQSFFGQYKNLQKNVPRAATTSIDNINSEYTMGTGYCKNCYLINSSEHAQDSMYSKLIQKGSDIVDCSYVNNSQLLYECFNVENCYDSRYLQNCKGCSESWFLKNCIGCSNCFGSINLRNKEYYFLNKKYSREEYFKKLESLGLEKSSRISGMKQKFPEFTKSFPYKFAEILNSQSCTGDFILNSKNCKNCYDIDTCEDSKNVYVAGGNSNVLDCTNMYIKAELCYLMTSAINVYKCNFCLYIFNSNEMWYSEQCYSCSDCFACIGLRNKKYCILNKQYTKEEYEKLVPKIIEHMQKTGEWGEFFPRNFSPFGYNISLAQEYFPLTKEEALAQGFTWHDEKTYHKNLESSEYKIPDTIDEVDDSVVQEILICERSGKQYKIIKPELEFYRKMKIPLPKLCPLERHKKRMKLRNPRKLFSRKCNNCASEISTTFSPERPEKVFCEKCYQEAVN